MAASTVRLHPDAPGASLARYLICEALSDNTPQHGAALAQRECKTSPQLSYYYDLVLQGKGNVAGGTSTTVGYAAELAQSGVAKEAFNLLVSRSVLGQLYSLMRRVPWRIPTPRESGGGAAGAWKGQGLPAPARSTLTDKVTIEYAESSVLMVLTKEALRFGPVTEAFVTRAVSQAVSTFIDGQLLNPAIAATSTSPASITYAASAVTSTGASAAQVVTDLTSMISAISTPMNTPRWIMRPQTLYAIYAKLAGAGASQPSGTLLGIPVIASSTSPHQIALVDPEAFAVATDEQVFVDLSTRTTVQMIDAGSAMNAGTGVGTTAVSMFQVQACAIRATLAASWAPIEYRSGSPSDVAGCCTMQVTY